MPVMGSMMMNMTKVVRKNLSDNYSNFHTRKLDLRDPAVSDLHKGSCTDTKMLNWLRDATFRKRFHFTDVP